MNIVPNEPTPRPWLVFAPAINEDVTPIHGADSKWLACAAEAADAEFIVRACNAHDELVAALHSAMFLIGRYCDGAFDPNGNIERRVAEIKSALANAEGSES